MQIQAVVIVRLVIEEGETIKDAENTIVDALDDAGHMAYVKGERIEEVEEEE